MNLHYQGETKNGFQVWLAGSKVEQDQNVDLWYFSATGFFSNPSLAVFAIGVKRGSRRKTVLKKALDFIDEHY